MTLNTFIINRLRTPVLTSDIHSVGKDGDVCFILKFKDMQKKIVNYLYINV